MACMPQRWNLERPEGISYLEREKGLCHIKNPEQCLAQQLVQNNSIYKIYETLFMNTIQLMMLVFD